MSFRRQLKALREAAGFTQEELAAIAGLSVHAVSALERGERRRPHVETVRALSAALDLAGQAREVFAASARPASGSAAGDRSDSSSLPLPPTSLLGRDMEMRTLGRWLAAPHTRLMTLTGPGGVGKTRLALELARAHLTEFRSRGVFVDLSPIRAPALVAPAIAEALGVVLATPGDLPGRLQAACDARPLLLVLDNFEQVLDAAPLVGDLLLSVGRLRVLATSRAALRVRGEREHAVEPLALDADAASDLSRAPAVRLFVERARDVQPDFRLTPANAAVVRAICRRLDALPLALELTAPWIRVLSLEDLLRRLEHDVLMPAGGPRDLPERQQTMNATVAWSYEWLSAGERRMFRRLGVLPGPFTAGAAAAVAADPGDRPIGLDAALHGLAALIDKSLVLRADAGTPRPVYRMLEAVRTYAARTLRTDERDEALDALTRYCLSEARRAAVALVGPAQGEWLDRVRDDLDGYRAALAWLLDRGRIDEACEMASDLLFFWVIRGHAIEGQRWFDEVARRRPLAPATEARMLVGTAAMAYTLSDLGRAREALERALPLAARTHDAALEARALTLLGHVERGRGDLAAARTWLARGAAAFDALAIPWGAGNALGGLAGVEIEAGHLDRADRLLDEATLRLRGAGPWFMTPVLCGRVILALRRRDPEQAMAVVRESLEHVRDLRDVSACVYALVPCAAAAALGGEDARAARIIGARDAMIERTGVTINDKSVRDLRAETERGVRARLAPDEWTRAYAAGRAVSIDTLVPDIDRLLAPLASARG